MSTDFAFRTPTRPNSDSAQQFLDNINTAGHLLAAERATDERVVPRLILQDGRRVELKTYSSWDDGSVAFRAIDHSGNPLRVYGHWKTFQIVFDVEVAERPADIPQQSGGWIHPLRGE